MNGNKIHVTPINDLIEHEDSEDCVCQPTPRLVTMANGADGWVITHHSLDGRGLTEVDHEQG